MSAGPGAEAAVLSPDELATLFLFESLDGDQLAWLAERGRVRSYPEGAVLFSEGEPASEFFVLLSGCVVLSQRVSDGEVETVRSSYRGSYTGAVQAMVGDRMAQVYLIRARVTEDSTFWVLPAEDFGTAMRTWFPTTTHLLEGLWLGRANAEAVVGQRERLLALGQLSAGLTHELNNPAAAAGRAAAALRERVAGMRQKLAALASGEIDGGQLQRLTGLQETLVERAAAAPRRSPLEMSDLEDELADWLERRGLAGPYELASVYASSGLDENCLQEVADGLEAEALEPALRWLAYTLETEGLMREIEEATTRISSLLGAVRQYSHMDRAPYESTDVRDGLESTLAILGHKIGPGITVVREYEPGLPRVPAYVTELNQVWTNLIDNALAAMAGEGTLTLRASRSPDTEGAAPAREESVIVEVGDTGPGVPQHLQRRIFEPFFTTKPVGEGTGLGLDISYRIVVGRHHGDLSVRSSPGDTSFVVRLPTRPQEAG